jgi:hypothetical protein
MDACTSFPTPTVIRIQSFLYLLDSYLGVKEIRRRAHQTLP